MKVELPAYLVSIVHTSLDLRIRERILLNRQLGFDPEGKHDDLLHLLLQARGEIESQSSGQLPEGESLVRIHTKDMDE